MEFSSVRAPGITGDIRDGSGIADMWDAVGAGIMAAGGTTDTMPVVIVAVGYMTAMPEAMHMKDMAEPTRVAVFAVVQDSAVERASMVEAGTTVEVGITVAVVPTAAGSMEVDAVKR